jgi:lactate permease
MALSLSNWLLAVLPVLILLGGILFMRWETPKAGAVAWIVALVVAFAVFGANPRLLALASSKGISLSIFVLLIIWGAVFMYNIADGAGAIKVIGSTLEKLTDDSLLRCLLFAWGFTSLLQGLAGFGVPVAVVAPFMVIMGYTPVTAVATCLVGHSWSISFGSMGSSYIAIQLVTGIPGEVIGPVMALLFAVAIYTTGFGVSHIYGGMAAVKQSCGYVLTAGTAMIAGLWIMNHIGAAQLATLIAAISGCAVLIACGAFKGKGGGKEKKQGTKQSDASFIVMCSPYFILIALSVIAQIPSIKSALKSYYLGLNYPAVQTSLGYSVEAAIGYSRIQLFSHPALLLLISALIGYAIYVKIASVDPAVLRTAGRATVNRCVPMGVGIFLMVMMALVMIDSGMTQMIAAGSAKVFEGSYGLLAPMVGLLGTFITGSNTNSNIMFGALQYETALMLGKSGTLFAAAQSVGGSLGVSMAPSTVMMGVSNVGLAGQEGSVMKITAKYCLGSIFLTGLTVWLLS